MNFKTFVAEKWARGYPVSDKYTEKMKNYIHHSDDVAGHKVAVLIHKETDPDGESHHNIDFAIAPPTKKSFFKKKPDSIYTYNKVSQIKPEDGKKILNHVHKIVSHYVRKVKPEIISLKGNTDKKRKIYAQYGNALAKKFNGRADHDDFGTRITFNR